MRPTRRELFRWVSAAALAAQLPACGDNRQSRVFTNAQLAMLGKMADAVLPPDADPGAVELGVVTYIERLCLAFDSNPPLIFAGGPVSDRSGGAENDFLDFIELDRVADAAHRLRVLGSDAPPNAELLGPVIGLADQLRAGLDAALAINDNPGGLEDADRADLFDALPDDFRSLMIDLVAEGAFAAPEYGGNADGAGWRLCNFEGDVLPNGHSADAVSMPDAVDPVPLTSDVTDLIGVVINVLGGRVRA